jgi:chromosome partitioning protein
MKIIAVTNIKGGVGKTTTAVNLAYLCAASGRNTLLWDLDSQGAATYTLGVDPRDYEVASAKKLLSGKREIPELIVPTAYEGLDLLPSSLSYRRFDIHLNEHAKPTERLLKMSRSLREVYPALFMDCPAGISLLSENVLRAADAVIIPLLPTPLSVRMLVQLRDFLEDEGWKDVVLLPFFSMIDIRRSLHRDLVESTRREFPMILKTELPYWSEIERMSVRRAPLPAFAPSSAPAQLYESLWKEIRARLGKWPKEPAAD